MQLGMEAMVSKSRSVSWLSVLPIIKYPHFFFALPELSSSALNPREEPSVTIVS